MGPNTLYSMYMQIAGLVFYDLIVYMKNHSDDLNFMALTTGRFWHEISNWWKLSTL